MTKDRTECRTCGSKNLSLILDLGRMPLANDYLLPSEVADYKISVPLRVLLCADCSLVQLADTVDPKILYSKYAYVTSTSKTMELHLRAQVGYLLSECKLIDLMRTGNGKARVLEIASNTGIYLKQFHFWGCDTLGIEPASNIAQIANATGVLTRNEFFNSTTAEQIAGTWGQADLIAGRHVFAHIDDLKDLLAALEFVSHKDSLIVFEVHYLGDLFEKCAFDTFYHEHLSYVTVKALEALLKDSPFYLHKVNRYPIHGGSILFHLRYRPGTPDASVSDMLAYEKMLRLEDLATWKGFEERVTEIKNRLWSIIHDLKRDGKRLIGYGAPAKGNTLLNACGLSNQELDYLIDNTPFKQHRLAPGSWIPILGPEHLLKDKPDYALLLAWTFAEEIIQREKKYQRAGGHFIVPIPEPKIV